MKRSHFDRVNDIIRHAAAASDRVDRPRQTRSMPYCDPEVRVGEASHWKYATLTSKMVMDKI